MAMEQTASSISSYITDSLPALVRKGLKNTLTPVSSVLSRCIKKVDSDIESSEIESINSGSTC